MPGDVTAKMTIRPGNYQRFPCAHRTMGGSAIEEWSVHVNPSATTISWNTASASPLDHLPCAFLWHVTNMGLTPTRLLQEIWGPGPDLEQYNPYQVIGAVDRGDLVSYLSRFVAECFTRRWCDHCYQSRMADVGRKILAILVPYGMRQALMISHISQQAQGLILFDRSHGRPTTHGFRSQRCNGRCKAEAD